MNKARIVEVFESIQGEGYNIGVPSVFIRFFGCNLRCTYCDSLYAVDKEHIPNTKLYTIDQLINKVVSFKTKHIVFTGGEPLLYQDFIKELIKVLLKINDRYTFEIETNGTIKLSKKLIGCFSQINISPKLSSSGIEKEKRIKHDALNSFGYYGACFKFVVSCEEDLYEAIELRDKYLYISYLMPEGKDRKTIIMNSERVVKQCIDNDFLFSPREHIIIWNKKKGI